nr:venom polypeptide precursor [Doratifera vulnerans]
MSELFFAIALLSLLGTIENKGTFYPDVCNPIVIAHRGASGYVPEHTLGAYALAITMGADYIDIDLVMTKDGHLIARYDNELSLTTDVADHPEFADRRRIQRIDTIEKDGWFTEDFTLEEIKSLRAIERIPEIRPGNARMDGSFEIPTFAEFLDLVQAMQISENRLIGVYPEIKHSIHFQSKGLLMEKLLVDMLHERGYVGPEAPVYIQSFEISSLKYLSNITDLQLIQLMKTGEMQPYDQLLEGTTLTYNEMSTPEGLREIATYAHGVAPHKSSIINVNENNLGFETTFVRDAHAVGLKVHPYTFRKENYFLPTEYKSSNPSDDTDLGNFEYELRRYLETDIDGLFTDDPDVVVGVRGPC